MKERDIHPCFSCTLPDCDDRSSECALRRALSAYDRKRKTKRSRTALERMQNSIAYRELYGISRSVRRAETKLSEVRP